ncbi:MAG TPA: MFS transporter [Thermoleophilia bacterium]
MIVPPGRDSAGDVAPVSTGTTRNGDTLALTLMVFYLMSTLTLALMAVVTPELQRRFGLSASQIGLLTSAFMVAYGVVGIPAGVAAARWGGRALAVSCAFFVLGSVLFALSSSYAGFVIGRALQGLGGGMVLPVSSPLLAHALAPARRNRGWGVFASGKGAGALVALLAMPSVATLGGFRAVYLVTAGLALVIGLAALYQKPVRARPDHPEEATSFRALGGALGTVAVNRRVLLLGLFNCASLAVGTGVLMWTPDFLHHTYGTSVGVAAYLTAGLAVAQLVGAPAGAAGAARLGRMPVIAGSMVMMTVVCVLVPVVPGEILAFVMVVLVGFASLAYFSPRFAMVPEVVERPEQVGPATGLINAVGFGLSMLAPWLFGLVLDSGHGYFVGYLVLAGFGAAGALGVLAFRAPKRTEDLKIGPSASGGPGGSIGTA